MTATTTPPRDSPTPSTSAAPPSPVSLSGSDSSHGSGSGSARSVVPAFAPLRPRVRRFGPRQLVRGRARGWAAGLAVAAAVLAMALPGDAPAPGREPVTVTVADAREGPPAATKAPPAAERVSAAVRIADAQVVRLLAPGDEVDVLAADPGSADPARVVAHRAEVTGVPAEQTAGEAGFPGERGALLILSVSPATAAELAGAASGAQLAVSRW
ncbi:hypothetical protein [Streptomyces sp. NRRL F-2890]|uniref:hypothetical protein n=1 Tax=Streptomyces sp. NRRL F-2890 TaxID=1463845 RepID=UPI001F1B4FD7|nr:hypothetical protein [Streptomyces sp. NRRL F-2890]